MAHTNSTTHYSLPQFLSTDKPAWLTDVNPAYEAIDTGIYNAKTAADSAQSDATQALSDASTAGTKADTADAKGSGAVASIADAFDTTATYAVGDLVMYNNLLYICTDAVTTPGAWTGTTNWTRTTAEAQIDAVASEIPSTAADLPYSNGSNPNGTVGKALDELKQVIDISSSFTLSGTVTSGNLYIKAYYNPGERRVSGSASVHVSDGVITSGQNIININSYRPLTNITVPMLVKNSDGTVTCYWGNLNANGTSNQMATSTCKGVYFSFEYYI